MARDIAPALGSPWFALSARHGAFRVLAADGHVDVAALQGGSIEHDLGRRDFTVNAMAIPVSGGDLVDPFGGAEHLRVGLLAAVSDRIFEDDPLRLMRAPRFCHVLGMSIDPPLEGLMRAQVGRCRPRGSRAGGERDGPHPGCRRRRGCHRALGRPRSAGRGAPGGRGPWTGARESEELDRLLAHPGLVAEGEAVGLLAERLARPIDGVLPRPVALRLAMLLTGLGPAATDRVARRLKLSAAATSLLRVAGACFASGRCGDEALASAARPGRPTVSFLWAAQPWEPEVLLLSAARLATRPTGRQR